jgi:hypothetical protein
VRSSTAVSARLSFRVNRSRMAGAISCTRASCGAIGELHVRAGHSDGLRAYTLAGLANLTSAAARNRGGLRLHGCVGAVCVCACVDACACVCVDGAKPGGPNSPNAAHPALSLGVVALGTLLAALSRIAGLLSVLRAVACA